VIVENLQFPRDKCAVAEPGAGRGQLTLPLARKLPKSCKLYTLDSYEGPYRADLKVLMRLLRAEKLREKVIPLVGDVRDLTRFEDASFDIIVSNELFCELKRRELKMTSRAFFRILKVGGCMVHGNLSPIPESPSQRLLIDMDSSSKWSTSPARGGWFSPTPEEVASIFEETGFTAIRTVYVNMNIHYGSREAKRQLRTWGARSSFLRDRSRIIEKYGMDIPPEYITFCQKPSRMN